MKKISLIKTVFLFWVLLIIMSVSWFVYIFYNNFSLISSNILVLFALIIACISLVLSVSFISLIIFDVRKEIIKEREKQKNIRDVYSYNQVVEPPSMYN